MLRWRRLLSETSLCPDTNPMVQGDAETQREATKASLITLSADYVINDKHSEQCTRPNPGPSFSCLLLHSAGNTVRCEHIQSKGQKMMLQLIQIWPEIWVQVRKGSCGSKPHRPGFAHMRHAGSEGGMHTGPLLGVPLRFYTIMHTPCFQ